MCYTGAEAPTRLSIPPSCIRMPLSQRIGSSMQGPRYWGHRCSLYNMELYPSNFSITLTICGPDIHFERPHHLRRATFQCTNLNLAATSRQFCHKVLVLCTTSIVPPLKTQIFVGSEFQRSFLQPAVAGWPQSLQVQPDLLDCVDERESSGSTSSSSVTSAQVGQTYPGRVHCIPPRNYFGSGGDCQSLAFRFLTAS